MSGVIGSGKSSLTKLLADSLGTKAYYEPVKDNPVLPLFYKGNKLVEEGKWKTNPYAFLLQIYFLNTRFRSIKKAMQQDNNVLDRSIYEDNIFMKMNYEEHHTTKEEWNIYQDLLNNMMEELPLAAHKKSPDLMIMIKVSYPTMIERIKKRGRPYEQVDKNKTLIGYYKDLLEHYSNWFEEYNESPSLVIDGDKYNFVESVEDRDNVLLTIYNKLLDLGKLDIKTYTSKIEKLGTLNPIEIVKDSFLANRLTLDEYHNSLFQLEM